MIILFNHIFMPFTTSTKIRNTNKYLICQKCDHLIYELITGNGQIEYVNSAYSSMLKSGQYDGLPVNMTCEEIIIKKLLE